MASFLVWDTPGSPMEMQAACISPCSTSRRLPLPSSYCISPEMGNTSSTSKALLGGDPDPLVDVSVFSLDVCRERQLQSSPETMQRLAWAQATAPRQQHLQHPPWQL